MTIITNVVGSAPSLLRALTALLGVGGTVSMPGLQELANRSRIVLISNQDSRVPEKMISTLNSGKWIQVLNEDLDLGDMNAVQLVHAPTVKIKKPRSIGFTVV